MKAFKDICTIITSTTTMTNTFFCEYSILSEHTTRDACMTLFGGMTEKDDLRELGSVKLLGRWACVGEARGFCIVESELVESVQQWLNNWVPMADIKVTPCLDDNQQRELILKNKPSYEVVYDKVNNSPKEGESLYFIKYKFKDGSKNEGFKLFSNMTQEQDVGDCGKCTPYGRWHVPSEGWGVAIASSPSVFDMYKWAYNWNDLCDVKLSPVTEDKVTRQIIKDGIGFYAKHKVLMKKMNTLIGRSIWARFCGCF